MVLRRIENLAEASPLRIHGVRLEHAAEVRAEEARQDRQRAMSKGRIREARELLRNSRLQLGRLRNPLRGEQVQDELGGPDPLRP